MHGLDDGEQQIVVVVQLGALMGVNCVFDAEWVQGEPFSDTGELRLGRLIEADPGKSAALGLHRVDRRAPVRRPRLAQTIAVHGAVDNRRIDVAIRGDRLMTVPATPGDQSTWHQGAWTGHVWHRPHSAPSKPGSSDN